MNIEISNSELRNLSDLRELCISEDLLDLQSHDSINRAYKISNAWEALKVIERLNKMVTPSANTN